MSDFEKNRQRAAQSVVDVFKRLQTLDQPVLSDEEILQVLQAGFVVGDVKRFDLNCEELARSLYEGLPVVMHVPALSEISTETAAHVVRDYIALALKNKVEMYVDAGMYDEKAEKVLTAFLDELRQAIQDV